MDNLKDDKGQRKIKISGSLKILIFTFTNTFQIVRESWLLYNLMMTSSNIYVRLQLKHITSSDYI